jgi:hypothetical protein
LDLSVGAHVLVDAVIREYALRAVLNMTYSNDANRISLVELDGIRPLLQCVLESPSRQVVLRAVQVLANVAYRSSHTTGALVRQGADQGVLDLLAITDILGDPDTTFACVLLLTNCSCSARYRSYLAPIVVAPVLRVVEYALDPAVLHQSGHLIAALVFDHNGNKALFPARGALRILLEKISSLVTEGDMCPAVSASVTSLCLATASLLLFPPNHEIFYDLDGLRRVLDISAKTSDRGSLQALGMVLCALVPCPTELLRFHIDEFRSPIERLGAVDALRRIKYTGFDKNLQYVFPHLLYQRATCVIHRVADSPNG